MVYVPGPNRSVQDQPVLVRESLVKTILSGIIIQSMSSFNFIFDSSFLSFQFDIFANFSENIFVKIQIFDQNLIQVLDSKSQQKP